jgi:hypothetical protein
MSFDSRNSLREKFKSKGDENEELAVSDILQQIYHEDSETDYIDL